MSKYENLEKFLQKTNQEIIILTFDDVENIIESKLPYSAYTYSAFWSNTITHSIAKTWINSGYIAKKLIF